MLPSEVRRQVEGRMIKRVAILLALAGCSSSSGRSLSGAAAEVANDSAAGPQTAQTRMPPRARSGGPAAYAISAAVSPRGNGGVGPVRGSVRRLVVGATPAAGSNLTAARACFGEERFSLAGCAAVVYAIKRQAHAAERSFTDQAVAYCSSLKGSSPRQRLVQQLPDGDEPSWNEKQNRAWAAVRRVARLALAGRIPNPCPRAQHFGGMELAPDARRAAKAVQEGRWRPVRCHGQDISGTYFALTGQVIAAADAAGARKP